MAWAKRTATDYLDCIDQIRQFTQKTWFAGTVTPGSNTGEGSLFNPSASENSVAETWTITCTTAGGNDTAIFSVSGSVSGVQVSATAGVPYSIDKVSFVIVADGADFAISDSFSFPVTAGTAEWVQDRWDNDYDGAGGYELIQHGIGGGADEIYVGMRSFTDNTSYWNVEQSAFTGFVDGNPFDTQPGYMPEWCCGNGTSFEVWISASSRRINYCLIPVEGSHEMGGVGWLNSYASPSQWAYPAFCGGSRSSSSATIGSSGGNFPTGSNLKILWGTNIRTGVSVSPCDYGYFSYWQSPEDGFQRLYPASPRLDGNKETYGDLDGIFWPTPYVGGGGLFTALAVIVGVIADYTGTAKHAVGVSFRNVSNAAAGNISVMDLTGD